MVPIDKLPTIIKLSEYGGDYPSYINAVYEIFYESLTKHEPSFGSHKLRMKFKPIYQERAYTFLSHDPRG